MDNKKLNMYLGIGLLMTSFAMVLFAVSLVRPGSLGAYILHTQIQLPITVEPNRDVVDAAFRVNFDFPRYEVADAALFIPEYDVIELYRAEELLRHFDIGEIICVSEDVDGNFYVFNGEYGELHVNKYYNRMIVLFNNPVRLITPVESSVLPPLNAVDFAVHAALLHITAADLPFDYAKSDVVMTDAGFYVSFYRDVGGLLCLDHSVRVALDAEGSMLSMDYYHLSYERIATVNLITAKEAFYRLTPPDTGMVDLYGVSLVYRFLDSILQPAYVFKGTMHLDGEELPFEYFVNASRFN